MNEKLFIPTRQITEKGPTSPEKFVISDPYREVVLKLMVNAYSNGNNNSADHRLSLTPTQIEDRDPSHIELQDLVNLIRNYREDPKKATGLVRVNLINLVKNHTVSEKDRRDLLEKYLKAYLALLPKLDLFAFPAGSVDEVYKGVPAYIPDGLSDMGGQAHVDQTYRSREKIRVRKKESHQLALPSFLEAIWSLKKTSLSPSSEEVKKYLIKTVMVEIYKNMKYDVRNLALNLVGSLPLDHFSNSNEPSAVCRHIALETQIRLQALGLESRLLKCNMDNVPHVANLVRIQGKWYLIDTTNPEFYPGDDRFVRPYIREISSSSDLNQDWFLDRWHRNDEGAIVKRTVKYTPRTNMYYRILDNRKK